MGARYLDSTAAVGEIDFLCRLLDCISPISIPNWNKNMIFIKDVISDLRESLILPNSDKLR